MVAQVGVAFCAGAACFGVGWIEGYGAIAIGDGGFGFFQLRAESVIWRFSGIKVIGIEDAGGDE